MAAPDRRTVEVAYALPVQQWVVEVPYEDGLTARQAVERSGLLQERQELSSRDLDLGVFGRPVHAGQPLRPGDRVEIYRPLKADPRETRRRLAAAGGTMGRPPAGRPR